MKIYTNIKFYLFFTFRGTDKQGIMTSLSFLFFFAFLVILVLISVCTSIGAWTWLWDPNTSKISFHQSLWNHPFFTISCITLFTLFLCGIHKRVVAPSIIASRCRHVLSDYNMSCDETGKLILLKPRPSIWHMEI